MTPKQTHLSHPTYRHDIDGLRGMAVLSVVSFHAFPVWVRGGFIGVDVFFVISGYLISTIIFENLEKDTFRFSEFYSRRIRRIFPALSLVLFACLAFGWFALLADEYKQLGKHIAAGAGFVSNFIFWKEAGYFDNSSETKPLLHLWSLGIEEQFYIAWPLLLWLAWKRRFNLLTITIVVTITTFILNIKGVRQNMAATFYSPQTRFWELLAGSLLAWVRLYKSSACSKLNSRINLWLSSIVYSEKYDNDDKTFSDVLSFVGLFLLIYGFLGINKYLSFPGKWALVPVLGAVLIITAGSKAWVNRSILSNKIAVWFGLISFPLYLWHWPLLSFARIVESEVPSRNIRMGAVFLSIALAWLTYKFVERPLRFGKSSNIKVATLVVIMTIIGGVGYNTFERDGLSFRQGIDAKADDITAIKAEKESMDICDSYFPDWTKVTDNPCRMQKKGGNTIAIIGDSHAGHLYVGMSELVGSNAGIVDFAASCAAPYIGVSSGTADSSVSKVREGAYKLINSAYNFIIHDEGIETVILAHNPLCSFGDVKDTIDTDNKNEESVLRNGMIRTFDALTKSNKNVVVLFDNPYLPYEPSMCVHRPFRITDKGSKCSFPRGKFDSIEAFSRYKSIVYSVVKDYKKVSTYDLSLPFCDEENCYLSIKGKILYRDRQHLSYDGSRYAASYIMKNISVHDTKN